MFKIKNLCLHVKRCLINLKIEFPHYIKCIIAVEKRELIRQSLLTLKIGLIILQVVLFFITRPLKKIWAYSFL